MKITKPVAYVLANEIDQMLNKIAEQYPLEDIHTREEQLAYLLMIRTIKTSLDIMEDCVMFRPDNLKGKLKWKETIHRQ